MEKDEYKIGVLLKEFGVYSPELLKSLSDHLDKVVGQYMDYSKDIRKAAFTEVKCFILKAVIDSENDDVRLKNEIAKLADSL